jgi:hypothetical protein
MDISFSVPVSGTIHIEGDSMTITVNKAETRVFIPFPDYSSKFSELEPGETMDSILLKAAKEFVLEFQYNSFSGPELYELAISKHPRINKNSFLSRIIASTPNHPSYHHFASGKDYFNKIGRGLYQLNDRYLLDANGLPLLSNNP